MKHEGERQLDSEGGYEFLEHTADIKIHVYAPTLEGIFQKGAEALMQLLFEGAHASPPEGTSRIEVAAENVADLFVDWLSELLYLAHVNSRIYSPSSFHELSDVRLSASTGWRHAALVRDVKAVTYHEASLRHDEAGQRWQAIVVFDV